MAPNLWVFHPLTSFEVKTRTPFFRPIVLVGRSPMGVAFGISWNGGVVRVNVATLKGVAFGISEAGSDVWRLRPHNRRDPKPRRDRQNGTKKKRACRRD